VQTAALAAWAAGLVLGVDPGVSRAGHVSDEPPGVRVYRETLPSVLTVRVVASDGSERTGAGFLTLRDGIAATAWHVVKEATSVRVVFSDGEEFESSGLVDKDEKRDLAIIRVKVAGRPLLKLEGAEPPVGSPAFVIGAPRGLEFSVSDGMVAQVRVVEGVRLIQFTCPASPGNSGGPLLGTDGAVLGVVSRQFQAGQNLNFAIPARSVLGLDATLPTTPWTDAVVRSSNESANSRDDALREAIAAASDAAVVASIINERFVKAERGFANPLPSLFFDALAQLARAKSELRRVAWEAQPRKRFAQLLLFEVENWEEAFSRLKASIDVAYASDGWSKEASELLAHSRALGRPLGDEVQGLLGDEVFVRAGPTWFRDLASSMRLEPRLGVLTLSREPLHLLALEPGEFAAALGLRAEDRILGIDGSQVSSLLEFKQGLLARADTAFSIKVRRNGRDLSLTYAPKYRGLGGRHLKPRAPDELSSTKKVGERCAWDEECERGFVCPYDRCIPKTKAPGTVEVLPTP